MHVWSYECNPAEDWDKAIAQMQVGLGGVDVLVNNAGVLVAGKMDVASLEAQLALIDINYKGVLISCHKVRPLLRHSKSKIINLSSASAIYDQPEIAAYSASKFFMRGLSEAVDIEWSKSGVWMLDVMPLWVRSN